MILFCFLQRSDVSSRKKEASLFWTHLCQGERMVTCRYISVYRKKTRTDRCLPYGSMDYHLLKKEMKHLKTVLEENEYQ